MGNNMKSMIQRHEEEREIRKKLEAEKIRKKQKLPADEEAVRLKKSAKCKKLCDKKLEKDSSMKLERCSNQGQTYDSWCHQRCDFWYVDQSIRAKEFGKCDDMHRRQLSGYESDEDWYQNIELTEEDENEKEKVENPPLK